MFQIGNSYKKSRKRKKISNHLIISLKELIQIKEKKILSQISYTSKHLKNWSSNNEKKMLKIIIKLLFQSKTHTNFSRI